MSDKTISSLEVGVEAAVVAERISSPEARICDIQKQAFLSEATPVETIPLWIDRNCLSNDSQGLGLTERSPALRPGRFFELASFATPARWSSVRGEADHSSLDREFQSEIHVALMPFVEQLPIGAALVADYELLPTGSGAVRLHVRFGVDVATTDPGAADLEGELQTCLSALSDHFSFRISETGDPSIRQRDALIWIVRPLGVDLRPQAATGIGFATRHDDAPTGFRFPAMKVSRSAIGQSNQGSWHPWSAALRHAFKAARGSGHALRIRVRLTRERLSEDAMSSLRRLKADDLDHSANDKDMVRDGSLVPPPYSPTMLNALVAGWSAVAADALRIELEAEETDGRVSESLLRILATELFPGLPVEIVAAKQSDRDSLRKTSLDLSNLYPLAAGLPPLLPHPGLLDTLDFARHYSNPSFELPAEGLLLGIAPMNGFEQAVRISGSTQAVHSYVVGQTGSGKSTFMFNSICQHMDAGDGVTVQEPAGDLADAVLEHVPANRVHDVVIIDPREKEYPVGLNPFDFGGNPTAAKVNRFINDQLDFFDEQYDMRVSGGPGFEMFYRYSALLASTAPHNLEGLPKGPPTLLTIVAVLNNDDLRNYLLARCCSSFLGEEIGNEIVRFFENAQKQSGDQSFKNWVHYVGCKQARQISNTEMRRLLCTPRRTIDFREIIDEKRILIVRPVKGEMGGADAKLLGRLITKFIFQAALSRSDMPREERTPHYFFLDEFQNFVCRDAPEMLAESRKYGLHVTLAHQTLSQLVDNGSHSMLNSILGNCANRYVFRVGLEEAKVLEPAFLPAFDAYTMCQLPNHHVLARTLAGNRPTPPYVFTTLPPRAKPEVVGGVTNSEAARAWSREKYSSSGVDTEFAKPPAHEKSLFKTLFDLGTNDEGPSVSDGPSSQQQEHKMTLIGDLIAIRPGTVENGRAYIDLREASEQAPARWRGLANTESPATQPQLGGCYWTTNRSLILVCSVAEKGASGLVIAGGHGERLLRGTVPGEAVGISQAGKLSSTAKLPSLLGLDLSAVADVSLEDNKVFDTAIDESGSWLMAPAHRLNEVVPGFYLTNNQSLVFVTHSKEAGTSWRATVCHGGHGIENLSGEKPFESYKLSLIGQYEISGENAIKIPTTTLGHLAGMSLARHLPLNGADVPEALLAASQAGTSQPGPKAVADFAT